ncbi:hypothetical protein BH18THE1_BH18THE1_12260 [soil metagenome]
MMIIMIIVRTVNGLDKSIIKNISSDYFCFQVTFTKIITIDGNL